jgi:hypothetical protein
LAQTLQKNDKSKQIFPIFLLLSVGAGIIRADGAYFAEILTSGGFLCQ